MAEARDPMSIDELFARYRASGRPGFLAQVFDATAPELLRTAMHLAPDPAAAEDLVQSTFVTAIHAARRFQAGGRVLPWLLGILGNLAREQRRAARRTPDPERLAQHTPADPAASAQAAELDRRVDEELDRLADPYRSVLVLHLRHGLQPAEIADALGRSPGTVRSQLARGLERLRRGLPAGFATALAVGLTTGRGLAAVRRAVVVRATVAAPWIAVQAWYQLAATHPVRAGVLAAAACVATVFVTGALREPRAAKSEPAGAVALPPVTGRLDGVAADQGSPVLARVPAPDPTDRRRRVLVRVTGADPGGVAVRLSRRPARDGLLAERPARTDRTGRAVIPNVEPGRYSLRLDRRDGPEFTVTADRDAEVEVGLDGGLDLRGRVVDGDGRPIPGAALWLARGGLADLGLIAGHSREDGSFAIPGVADDRAVAALAPGFSPCAPVPVTRARDGAIVLVLEPGAARFQGRVLDPDGRPIAGALVRVGIESPPFRVLDPDGDGGRLVVNRIPLTLRTDDAGRFHTSSVRAGSRVAVYARARDLVGATMRIDFARDGSVTRDIVLARGGTIRGQVVDDGTPVAGVLVQTGAPVSGPPGWYQAGGYTDRRGVFELAGVTPGMADLRVFGGLRGALQDRLVVAAGTAVNWRGDFAAVPGLRGRVRDHSGRPVAAVTVRVHGSLVREVSTDRSGGFEVRLGGEKIREIEVLDTRGPVPLRLFHHRGRPAVAAGEPLELVVPERRTPGGITGFVAAPPTGIGGARVRAWLRHQDSTAAWVDVAPDAHTGAFAIAGLHPGRYDLRLAAGDLAARSRHGIEIGPGQIVAVGRIELQPGGRCQLRLTDRGRLLDDHVNLRITDRLGRIVLARNLVRPDFRSPVLPAGEYHMLVWSAAHPIVGQMVRITAAGTATVPLDLGHGIRVAVEVEGLPAPAPGRAVALRATWRDAGGAVLATNDYFREWSDSGSSATARLGFTQKLLPGRYRLEVRGEGQRIGTAPVVVGYAPVTVRIRIQR